MPDTRGLFMVSVDLDADIDNPAQVNARALHDAADQLVALFDRCGVPATFSVADPAHSAATDSIRRSQLGHEIAILGDRAWVGRGAGRTRFARELVRRVEGAAAQGVNISTLALRNTELNENLDLLVKHRISVVRSGQRGESTRRHGFHPQSLRFGVWSASPTCCLPNEPGWFSGAWQLSRAIRRAAAAGTAVHLLVDGPALAGTRSAWSEVERTLELVQKLSTRGQVTVRTLQQMAARLARPKARSSRSVLSRRAA